MKNRLVGYCHGGPQFCKWGCVGFSGSRSKWIIARQSDGAIMTSFNWGKADIHVFDMPTKAIRFLENMKKINGRPCIVRLRNVHYGCFDKKKLHLGWIEKGEINNIKCYDYAPDDRRTIKYSEDWVNFDWQEWENRFRGI